MKRAVPSMTGMRAVLKAASHGKRSRRGGHGEAKAAAVESCRRAWVVCLTDMLSVVKLMRWLQRPWACNLEGACRRAMQTAWAQQLRPVAARVRSGLSLSATPPAAQRRHKGGRLTVALERLRASGHGARRRKSSRNVSDRPCPASSRLPLPLHRPCLCPARASSSGAGSLRKACAHWLPWRAPRPPAPTR